MVTSYCLHTWPFDETLLEVEMGEGMSSLLSPLESESESHSVVSVSLQPHGLYKSMEVSRPEYCSG